MNETESSQIKDIPKFKEMRQTMQGFNIIKTIFPFANPLLKLFGIETAEIKEALAKFPELKKEFEELSTMPDKFNDIFASKGFIIFDFLNLDVVKEAVKIAETDINKAEIFLINHFNPENVETYLNMMFGVRAFRSRMDLAKKALIDFKEERYHACIPVVLMLTDGLVNELNPMNVGIAAEKVDLRAWDCITSHEKGLNTLKTVIFKGRTKTITDEINVPYRHGILHGMDLGYDNKTVAVKTWALLFAVRDWAVKAENKLLEEPQPKPKETLKDVLTSLDNHNKWKNSFDEIVKEWRPRTIIVGIDIPKSGNIEDYEVNSPERKLVEFLTYWKKKNFGFMANCIWDSLKQSDTNMAGRVRKFVGSTELEDFELTEIVDETIGFADIKVLLKCRKEEEFFDKEVEYRLIINEDENGRAMVRGMQDATWGVQNWGHGI